MKSAGRVICDFHWFYVSWVKLFNYLQFHSSHGKSEINIRFMILINCDGMLWLFKCGELWIMLYLRPRLIATVTRCIFFFFFGFTFTNYMLCKLAKSDLCF
uniref:Uncharacterized protein n=1 Tax=Anguilla anguilla TaxID=7936 RepID=A0A0E9PR71_ANGAN